MTKCHSSEEITKPLPMLANCSIRDMRRDCISALRHAHNANAGRDFLRFNARVLAGGEACKLLHGDVVARVLSRAKDRLSRNFNEGLFV